MKILIFVQCFNTISICIKISIFGIFISICPPLNTTFLPGVARNIAPNASHTQRNMHAGASCGPGTVGWFTDRWMHGT